jgi:ubiquitin-conjugating enzyme E2 O
MRNLKPGEVGIAYYPMGRREICSEDEFELLDRTFRPGSVCKRFQDDTMSGIVLGTNVDVRVQHAINHIPLDRWVSLDETNPGHELEIGDHIIYDDWVGQVCLFPPLLTLLSSTKSFLRQIIEVRVPAPTPLRLDIY